MSSMKTEAPFAGGARILAVALACAVAGCVPVAPEPFISAGLTVAQAGTAAFRQGEMQAAVRHPLAEVHNASLRALKAWSLKTDVVDVDAKRSIITAREAGGRLIEINAVPVSDIVTSLRIKVGFFGDQPVSRLLLDEILKELGAVPVSGG